MRAPRPEGVVTRGTTGINRLRRSDRWLMHHPDVARVLHSRDDALVVDLGYGAMPVTTLELAARLRTVRRGLRVVGLEIDPDRVVPGRDGVEFARGGFELAGLRPVLIRAFNVLRQYPEEAVAPAWDRLRSGLAPGGLLLDGTCDELGRRCAWVLLDEHGPRTLTLAWSPFHSDAPSDLAERLPKALIHRNVPGNGSTSCCRRRIGPGRRRHRTRRSDRACAGARRWTCCAPRACRRHRNAGGCGTAC